MPGKGAPVLRSCLNQEGLSSWQISPSWKQIDPTPQCSNEKGIVYWSPWVRGEVLHQTPHTTWKSPNTCSPAPKSPLFVICLIFLSSLPHKEEMFSIVLNNSAVPLGCRHHSGCPLSSDNQNCFCWVCACMHTYVWVCMHTWSFVGWFSFHLKSLMLSPLPLKTPLRDYLIPLDKKKDSVSCPRLNNLSVGESTMEHRPNSNIHDLKSWSRNGRLSWFSQSWVNSFFF